MPINITDEFHAATTKGKIASAKEVFLTGDTENLQQIGEKTHQLEDSIKNIAITGGASTATAVTFDNAASGMAAVTAQAAIDELSSKISEERTRVDGELANKFDKESVAQEFGNSEELVMSQKAVSNKFNELITSLKAEFSYKGIAQPTTNPGVPDSNVFYIAGEGTYTNFSNLVIEAGQLGILKWNGTWSKEVLEIGAGGGNMILDWNTDVATTRKQVPLNERKVGIQITYKNGDGNIINEQFIGALFSDSEWVKDSNWEQIPNQRQINYIHANMLHPIRGKNFFNKQDVSTHVDGYVSESGNIISNSSWSTFTCKVNPQKNYIVNGSNIRVAFFNDELFISHVTSSNKFTTPGNCNIAKISVLNVLLQDADNFIVNEGDTLDLTSTYWEPYIVKEDIDKIENKIDEHINSAVTYEYNRINQSSVLKENYILNKETGEFEYQEGAYSMSIPLDRIDIIRIIGFQASYMPYYVLVKNGAVLPSITIVEGNNIDITVTGCSEIRVCSSTPSKFKLVIGAIFTLKGVKISEAIENKVDKKLGKNIFNCNSPLNIVGWCYDGRTINSTLGEYKEGGQIKETSFFTSYYIPVKPNTKYTTTFKIGSNNSFIHLYDKTKSITRTINDQSSSFTTAENEYFIIISAKEILYKLSIEEGDTATENTPYEDYVLLSKKEYDDFVYKSSILSGLKIVAHLADWEGKNVAGYGDSITELQEESEDGVATSGWLKTVGDYFGFNKRYNRGIGGTTIRNYNKEITVKVNPNGGNKNYGVPDEQKVTCCQAMCSWSRIKAQFPEEIKDTIDLVLFMGGTNDFGGVGDIGDGTLPKWSTENNYDDEWMADNVYNPERGDFPQNTFKGAIASTILKLQRWMPYARIVLVTQLSGRRTTAEAGMTDFCYDSHGKSPYDYIRDAIMVAEMMSTPYIDLFGTCGINQFNSALFIQDIVHPSAFNSNGKRNGVSSLARAIIGGLKSVLPYSREETDNDTYVD